MRLRDNHRDQEVTMLEFKVFEVADTGIVYVETIAFDPKLIESIKESKRIYELQKSKKVYIYPQSPEAVQFLMKPKSRGRTAIPDEIVIYIHEEFVERNQSPIRILYQVHAKFGIELSMNLIKSILAQEKYVEAGEIDHLRSVALKRMPKKTGRKKKITDEMKDEFCRLHKEQGMSGNQISKKYNVSSMSVNTALRERFGYRRKREPVAILVSE